MSGIGPSLLGGACALASSNINTDAPYGQLLLYSTSISGSSPAFAYNWFVSASSDCPHVQHPGLGVECRPAPVRTAAGTRFLGTREGGR